MTDSIHSKKLTGMPPGRGSFQQEHATMSITNNTSRRAVLAGTVAALAGGAALNLSAIATSRADFLPAPAISPSNVDPIFAAIGRCNEADEAERVAYEIFMKADESAPPAAGRRERVMIGRTARCETSIDRSGGVLTIVQRTFDDPAGEPRYAYNLLEIEEAAGGVPDAERDGWIAAARADLERDRRRVKRARSRAGITASWRASSKAIEARMAALQALAGMRATTDRGAVAALRYAVGMLDTCEARCGGYDQISDEVVSIIRNAIDAMESLGGVDEIVEEGGVS